MHESHLLPLAVRAVPEVPGRVGHWSSMGPLVQWGNGRVAEAELALLGDYPDA